MNNVSGYYSGGLPLPRVILPLESGNSDWVIFSNPQKIISTSLHSEIIPCVQELENVANCGLYAAGFISYEAAAGFDDKLVAGKSDSKLPLLWFGVFEKPEPYNFDDSDTSIGITGQYSWRAEISEEKYIKKIKRIKEYLRSGDTYQVNFTLRLHTDFPDEPFALFAAMLRSQRGAGYPAFIETEDYAICSVSPELFFSRVDNKVTLCPMKGTAKRGKTLEDDNKLCNELQCSEKNRAENVMIVDMIRNDLGRVAVPGSVRADELFTIERYPTVLQMISTVTGESTASLSELISALFPCASITGAPKRRTMEIIDELEESPRGIYTGSIGIIKPGGDARFNVAIRTAVIDKKEQSAIYGAGGGIVWDSVPEEEYNELLTKADVLTADIPDFSLLETILLDNDKYYLLDYHLERLQTSAEYFNIEFSLQQCRMMLEQVVGKYSGKTARVRLLVSCDGEISVDDTPFVKTEYSCNWRIVPAEFPVNPENVFLYHKTTNREIYVCAKECDYQADDVLLWNENGEITESTIANVVIEIDGEKFTPPVRCGLLPGVFRRYLLEEGIIKERTITMEDVRNAGQLWLINSLRGWIPAELDKKYAQFSCSQK